MKESKLLPFLRSQTQGELLARLFLNPDREFTLSALARAIGSSVPGVHHEIERLYNAGYINERREGRNRLVSARLDSVIAEPLTALVALSYGPIPVIEGALAGAKGIAKAFIFGSWAKRYSGETGGVPNDIDLGIIGSATTDEIEDLLEDAKRILRRDIDIKKFTMSNWNEGSSMIDEIKGSPHYFLDLK